MTNPTLTIDELHEHIEKPPTDRADRARRTALRSLLDTRPEIRPLLKGNLADPVVQESIENLYTARTQVSDTTAKNYIGWFRSAIKHALHALNHTPETPNDDQDEHPELPTEPDPDHDIDPPALDGELIHPTTVAAYIPPDPEPHHDLIEAEIPIRHDLRITIPLPTDLTTTEARRITRIITAYAIDE